MTQLDYLRWLVQLTGETLGSDPTAADYVQWARAKGMNPSGGWQPGTTLTREVLAQTLVQFFNINPNKQGGDYVRILTREGIILPNEAEITRVGLVSVVDDFGFQSRTAQVSVQVGSPAKHSRSPIVQGDFPPGWLNPRNPHYHQYVVPTLNNSGGPSNPGNKGP